ncbi:hypothetical protein [Amycolatopsis methanolica]|uniref:hypothetical protein n=1 Tax=Amycolatopsis methanolica TaxID=1814 RepID=UPI00342F46B6
MTTTDEFASVIVDQPTMLFAAVERDGSVWTYASRIVRPDGRLFRPVAEEIGRRGLVLVSEAEYADDEVMFSRAAERRYAAKSLSDCAY